MQYLLREHDLLKPFERDMYNLIGNIEILKVSDPAACEMNDEVAKINSSNKVIVNADKTGNKYDMTASDYKQLMHDNLTQDYKLDNSNKLAEINEDTKKHARSLQIVDRMERHSESNAFLTIKDHKPEFPNTIKCRIINPASNNLGKVSKRVLDKINTKCRAASSVSQWRSPEDVLNWFSQVHSNNRTKKKSQFLQFDICEKSCRKSVLLDDGKVWTKKR